jgi:competence CoiA-like predicted nuclease
MAKISTAKTPDGGLVTAGEAESGSVNYCPACGQSVRVHKQQVLHGPADHFEHLEANPYCPLFGNNENATLKRQASPTPL